MDINKKVRELENRVKELEAEVNTNLSDTMYGIIQLPLYFAGTFLFSLIRVIIVPFYMAYARSKGISVFSKINPYSDIRDIANIIEKNGD